MDPPVPPPAQQEDDDDEENEDESNGDTVEDSYAAVPPDHVMGNNAAWLEDFRHSLVPAQGRGDVAQVVTPSGQVGDAQAVLQSTGDAGGAVSAQQAVSGNVFILIKNNRGIVTGIHQQVGSDSAPRPPGEPRPALGSAAPQPGLSSQPGHAAPLPQQSAAPGPPHAEELPKLQNLIANTGQEMRQSCRQGYVETPALDAVIRQLEETGACLILGLPGLGKTTLALQAMAHFQTSQQLRPVHMDRPSQWEWLPGGGEGEAEQEQAPSNDDEEETPGATPPAKPCVTQENCNASDLRYVVLVEDIFGKGNYNEDLYEGWEAKASQMLAKVRAKQVKLIVVSRTHIYQTCTEDLKHNELFQSLKVIQLQEEKYWGSRCQEEILSNFLRSCGSEIGVPVSDLIRASAKSPIGFPQSCRYFASNPEAQKLGAEFFRNPAHFLSSQFRAMKTSNPRAYFVLVLTWLKNGRLSLDFLQDDSAETAQFLSRVQAMCGLREGVNIGQVRDVARSLCNVYLSPNVLGDGFTFSHQSVWDSLVVVVCESNLQEALKQCSIQQLSEYIITGGCGRGQTELTYTVPRQQWPLLAARLVRELTEGNFKSALQHPALHDPDFVKELTTHSLTPDDIDSILQRTDDTSKRRKRSYRRKKPFSPLSAIIEHKIPVLAAQLIKSDMMAELPPASRWQMLEEAMSTACSAGDCSTAQLLIKHGVVVHASHVSAVCSLPDETVALLKEVYLQLKTREVDLKHYENFIWQCCTGDKVNSVQFLVNKTSRPRDCQNTLDRVISRLVKDTHPSSGRHHKTRVSELFKVLRKAGAKLTSEVDVWLAAGHPDPSALQELISQGADVTARDRDGKRPIEHAVSRASIKCLKLLIQAIAKNKGQIDLNYVDEKGRSLIYRALKANNFEVSEVLLQHGADLNIAAEEGMYPIHLCADFPHERQDFMKLLLEKSQDINLCNKKKETVLHIAAKEGNVCLLETLLSHHANANIEDCHGNLPLRLYCWHKEERWRSYYYSRKKCEACSNTVVKRRVETCLVQATDDKSHADKDGNTALHLAAQAGNLSMVGTLIEHMSDIDIPNNKGSFPLHCLCCILSDSQEKTCQQLKDHVADQMIKKTQNKNHQDIEGRTPLHLTLKNGLDHLSLLLLEDERTSANEQDREGNLPLHCHCDFYEYGKANVTPQRQRIATLLLEKTRDKDLQNKRRNTPLHLAIGNGKDDLVDMLLEHGASTDIENEDGDLPLHRYSITRMTRRNVQVEPQVLKIEALLLERTQDKNHQNKNGNTPLHMAAKIYNCHFVEALLKEGVCSDIENCDGDYPLHILLSENTWSWHDYFSQKSDILKITDLLAQQTSDVNHANKKGKTPLHLAMELQQMQLVEVLLDQNARADVVDEDGKFPCEYSLSAFLEGHKQARMHLLQNICKDESTNGKGQTHLHLMLATGESSEVEHLLQKNASANIEDSDGNLPLHVLCERFSPKWQNVAVKLAKKTLNLNHKNKKGFTPLNLAFQEMNVPLIEILLKQGAQADPKDSSGTLLLSKLVSFMNYQYRCRKKQMQQVDRVGKLLIDQTPDVNIVDKHGESLLLIACRAGLERTAETLLVRNADANVRDKTGASPLQLFCEQSSAKSTHTTERVSAMLVKRSNDCNQTFQSGHTVLHKAIIRRHVLLAEVLLQHGAKTDVETKTGDWPLHLFCEHVSGTLTDREAGVGRMLVEKTEDINHSNKAGGTPLHVACKKGNFSMLERLLANRARTDLEDNTGSLPLHVLCEETSKQLVEEQARVGSLLIQNTTDLDYRNCNEHTPLHRACIVPDPVMMKLLLINGAKTDIGDAEKNLPLHLFIMHKKAGEAHNMQEVSTMLVEKTSDKNHKNKANKTPLDLALGRSDFAMANLLLTHGAAANVSDETGKLPLHRFSSMDGQDKGDARRSTGELLVEKTLTRDHRDADGRTPLHAAVLADNLTMMEPLLDLGAGVNVQDSVGCLPLHLLCMQSPKRSKKKNKGMEVRRRLEEKFVFSTSDLNLHLRNAEGLTPLHAALQSGNARISQLILEKTETADTADNSGSLPLHVLFISDKMSPSDTQCIGKRLIAKTSDVSLGNKDRDTPLHLAMKTGNWPMIELLLKHGAITDAKNRNGDTPLHGFLSQAPPTRTKQWKGPSGRKMQVLLDRCISTVNSSNDKGNTVLHLACRNGHFKSIKTLLRKNAETDVENMEGSLPLHSLCSGKWQDPLQKHMNLIGMLVDQTADINHQDKDGSTPLHLAVKSVSLFPLAKLLLQNGARADLVDGSGALPLHYYCTHVQSRCDEETNMYVETELRTKASSINQTDNDGFTPLHLAVTSANITGAYRLLMSGADVNVEDSKGNLSVHLYCSLRCKSWPNWETHEYFSNRLIEKTSNISKKNQDGDTPLHLVLMGNNMYMAKLLVNNADVHILNNAGDLPLHVVCSNDADKNHRYEMPEVQIALVQRTSDLNSPKTEANGSTPRSCENKQESTCMDQPFQGSLDAEMNANTSTETLQPCPHAKSDFATQRYAAIKTQQSCQAHTASDQAGLSPLQKKISGIDHQNKKGETPLHVAAKHGNLNMMEVLLDNHASADFEDSTGSLPLHWYSSQSKSSSTDFAALYSHQSGSLKERVCMKLTQATADINHRNSEGQTPLHIAARYGHGSTVEILLSHNAKHDVEDNAGNFPVHLWCCESSASSEGYWMKKSLSLPLAENASQVNHQNKDGRTPLHVAARRGNRAMMDTLLDHQAQADIEDKEGNLPLHLCFSEVRGCSGWSYDRRQMAQTLAKKTTDLYHQNRKGETPLSLAEAVKDGQLVEALLTSGAKMKQTLSPSKAEQRPLISS